MELDYKYGVYGMVIDKAQGDTPSGDERAVRGLGPEAPPSDT